MGAPIFLNKFLNIPVLKFCKKNKHIQYTAFTLHLWARTLAYLWSTTSSLAAPCQHLFWYRYVFNFVNLVGKKPAVWTHWMIETHALLNLLILKLATLANSDNYPLPKIQIRKFRKYCVSYKYLSFSRLYIKPKCILFIIHFKILSFNHFIKYKSISLLWNINLW